MAEVTTTAPPAAPPGTQTPRMSGFREFWFYFSQNGGAVVGLTVFAFLVIVALLAPWIAPHDPAQQYRDAFLTPPIWDAGGDPRFILGTDAIGRDMLSRIMHGGRYSLLIGCVVVAIALTAGVILGLIAGYARGWLDVVISRLLDLVLAFPYLLLALVFVAVLGPGLVNAMIAVAITMIPYFARLTRASVLAERGREYVIASKVSGAGHLRLVLFTILPNCVAPLIVQATLGFSDAVLGAAALGFLGLGAQPPAPEWGTMLADSREFIKTAWWVITLPGLAIFITVLAVNLVGDGLRDALDPKLKRS